MLIIPIPGRLGQKNHMFKASMDYIAKSYLRKQKQANVLKYTEL